MEEVGQRREQLPRDAEDAEKTLSRKHVAQSRKDAKALITIPPQTVYGAEGKQDFGRMR